jgi:gluconate 2-dehydrogenase gamma chain
MSRPEHNNPPHPGVAGPGDLPPPGVLAFFTPHEARTVEALAATLLPGTPEDPGASEAGVVDYIDAALWYEDGFTTRTYTSPPFAVPYEGEEPPTGESNQGQAQQPSTGPGAMPQASSQASPTSGVIRVPKDLLDRYGPQSPLTPQDLYRIGLPAVDAYARRRFDRLFADLEPQAQEQIVADLAANQVPLPGAAPSSLFFAQLRTHVIEGMFSDPLYRGNRDMVGWKLIGYPGAQRAYSPAEIRTEGYHRPPQSMADLPGFDEPPSGGPPSGRFRPDQRPSAAPPPTGKDPAGKADDPQPS